MRPDTLLISLVLSGFTMGLRIQPHQIYQRHADLIKARANNPPNSPPKAPSGGPPKAKEPVVFRDDGCVSVVLPQFKEADCIDGEKMFCGKFGETFDELRELCKATSFETGKNLTLLMDNNATLANEKSCEGPAPKSVCDWHGSCCQQKPKARAIKLKY